MSEIWREKDAQKLVEKLKYNDIVLTSGFFDPLHSGHTALITESAKWSHDSAFIVIVNGNKATYKKKGYCFMPVEERLEIIWAIRGVDYVIDFDVDNMVEVLKMFRPKYFTRGGDSSKVENLNQEEVKVCNEIGCDMLLGIGGFGKTNSSSSIINKVVKEQRLNAEWEKFRHNLNLGRMI